MNIRAELAGNPSASPSSVAGPSGPTLRRLIVGYNSASVLRHCARPMPDDVATTLVDNGSADATCETARSLGYDVLPLGANHGFGRAIMAGLSSVEDELVLVVNPDVQVEEAAVRALREAAARYPEADLFVPRITREDGREFFRFESRFEPRVKPRTIPQGDACIRALSGAAMLIRRKSFLAHGFDTNIFLYFEDDDLALNYAAAKRPIVFVSDAMVCHLGDASSGSGQDLEDLKRTSFGWSWGYVMTKYGLGEPRRALGRIALKLAGAALTGRMGRVRQQWRILKGMRHFVAGKPAPYLPAAMPSAPVLSMNHPERAHP